MGIVGREMPHPATTPAVASAAPFGGRMPPAVVLVQDMEAVFPGVFDVVRGAALGAGGVIDAGLSGDPGGL